MLTIFVASSTVLLGAIIWWHRRTSRSVIHLLPGPRPESWIYGNMLQLLVTNEYGKHEFEWLKTYGAVYRLRACFGQSVLMVSDPAAIKYILNDPKFHFGPADRKAAEVLFGIGSVFLATGENHKHLRARMNPWFSPSSVRKMLPTIRTVAKKLVDHWEDRGFVGKTVDISRSLHIAFLDVIGEAILEIPFNGLAGQSHLSHVQRRLVEGASGASKIGQLGNAMLPYIPMTVLRLGLRLPIPALRTLQDYRRLTDEMGERLVMEKRAGRSGEDGFVSRLVNKDATDKRGIPDRDIPAQVRSMLFAGDDTSGTVAAWILYRLAQMQDYQRALRQEIQNAAVDGTNPDLDAMPFLNAVINEVLRFYAPLPLVERMATEDCVLPLSKPITTTAGTSFISGIPVRKGQNMYIAIASYHRLQSIWGEDAEEFRPERWFQAESPCQGVALGPHASLLSFIGGPGVCIGYRLAILEIQVFVVELIRKFVLSLPAEDTVRPCFSITLVPKTADGVQHQPLHVERVE